MVMRKPQLQTLLLHRWLFLLSTSLLLRDVHAYASWLKCFVDLNDEAEVIMHHEIVPHEKARHPVQVVVRRQQESDDQASFVGSNTGNDTISYPLGTKTRFQVQLSFDPEAFVSSSSSTIQYVLETTQGATFIPPSAIMCHGKRAHATTSTTEIIQHAAHAQKQTTVSSLLEVDGSAPHVELFAVWATQYEAVTRTPITILTRRRIKQSQKQQQQTIAVDNDNDDADDGTSTHDDSSNDDAEL